MPPEALLIVKAAIKATLLLGAINVIANQHHFDEADVARAKTIMKQFGSELLNFVNS